MTRTRKIWLGILTFLPIVFFIGYFIAFFVFFIGMFQDIGEINNNTNPSNNLEFLNNMGTFFIVVFLLIFFIIFMGLGIMIYYIIHANKNPLNDSNKKLMWTLVLIFTSTIGCIVYYFVEIVPLGKSSKKLEPEL